MSDVNKIVVNPKTVPINSPLPISQAIIVDRTVYVAGQLGKDNATQKIVSGGIVPQIRMAFHNLRNVLEASGSTIENVVKVTMFLKDLNDYAVVNEEYGKVFIKNYPARTCFQAGKLPNDAAFEIECIALTGNVATEIITDCHTSKY